jgi:hypothetical protein
MLHSAAAMHESSISLLLQIPPLYVLQRLDMSQTVPSVHKNGWFVQSSLNLSLQMPSSQKASEVQCDCTPTWELSQTEPTSLLQTFNFESHRIPGAHWLVVSQGTFSASLHSSRDTSGSNDVPHKHLLRTHIALLSMHATHKPNRTPILGSHTLSV